MEIAVTSTRCEQGDVNIVPGVFRYFPIGPMVLPFFTFESLSVILGPASYFSCEKESCRLWFPLKKIATVLMLAASSFRSIIVWCQKKVLEFLEFVSKPPPGKQRVL